MTFNAIIEMSCGCVRHPRNIRRDLIPDIGDPVHCITHGEVEVTHIAYVSS